MHAAPKRGSFFDPISPGFTTSGDRFATPGRVLNH
jgi:hypothetical protein